MKLLFLAFSIISSSVFAQETLSNGGMPKDSPATILIERVPMGSGIPSIGVTTGYSAADPVADGLYHVPGYLPGRPDSFRISPRVVDVQCKLVTGTWYCSGYHVDGVLERGEDIYIRPAFVRVAQTTPAAPIRRRPVERATTRTRLD
jgi:hypothetical protein